MWVAKIRFKHDCILGNRCEKFNIALQSVAPSVYNENERTVTSSMHYMSGNPKDMDSFISDLEKEKDVLKLERKGNMFMLLERADSKAVGFYTPKIIFIKPVLIDEKGFETWELGAWDKKELTDFIGNVKKVMPRVSLEKLALNKIDSVFFPKLMPNLTDKQKRAIELAIKNGYYESPKRIDLRKLAKLMGIALSTYQQHLQSAEEKLIPNIFSYTR